LSKKDIKCEICGAVAETLYYVPFDGEAKAKYLCKLCIDDVMEVHEKIHTLWSEKKCAKR
jgi:hypothetical protein